MAEMVERVARAIAPIVPSCAGATCVYTSISECTCGQIARAAIQAMRKPTEAMKEACYESWRMRPGASTPEQLMEAMIDAAMGK